MSDDNKQELSPRGTLKIETDDETFEISFEDLNRYPGSLLARCVEDSIEEAEETIQYERDAEYLSIILDYMRDKSHKVVDEILSKTPEELLAICEEAQYFLLDDLVESCRKTLLDYGKIVVLPMITTTAQLGSIYHSAERENRGLILINVMTGEFSRWMHEVHEAIRLVDSSLYEVYKTTFGGYYGHHPILFKRPELSELKRIHASFNEARWSEVIYKLNSTRRNTAGYLHCKDVALPT